MDDSCSSPAPGRIPSEFGYWDHVGLARAQRLRRSLRMLFRVDPQLPDSVVRTWATTYYDADPVAEAFVEEVSLPRGQTEGRRLVDQALASGVNSVADAPRSLTRLFAEMETEPAWLDPQQVALGARVFRRWGTHLHAFAGAITLEGYRENSVAKPLCFTGGYTGSSAQRRFLETAAFWVDVAEPGALEPGKPGRATALRVRLMHVFVRKRLLAHPDWNLDAWGVPISQADALLTLMGGSFVPGYGLRLIGYRTSREEIQATMHFWRYVGHLMGVQPRWYPEDVDQALGLMFTSMVKGVGASGDDGKLLAHSYLDADTAAASDSLRHTLLGHFERGLRRGYVGCFVSPATHTHFGLPSPGLWRLAPLSQAPLVFARETLRRRSARFDDLLDRIARRTTARWVQSRLGDRRAEYRAAESFTR